MRIVLRPFLLLLAIAAAAEFYDFGASETIELPADDETLDLTDDVVKGLS